VTIIYGWRNLELGANRLTTDGIDRKCVLGKQRLLARPQKYPCDHIQNVVGTVAQGNTCCIHSMLLCQGATQLKATTIWVAGNLTQLLAYCCCSFWATTQRVLIRCQLHRVADSQLTFQLRYRLSRHIRIKIGHAAGSQMHELIVVIAHD